MLAEQEKVAQANAALTDRRLDTDVRKPADAARYRVEQEAQAARNAAIFTAERTSRPRSPPPRRRPSGAAVR